MCRADCKTSSLSRFFTENSLPGWRKASDFDLYALTKRHGITLFCVCIRTHSYRIWGGGEKGFPFSCYWTADPEPEASNLIFLALYRHVALPCLLTLLHLGLQGKHALRIIQLLRCTCSYTSFASRPNSCFSILFIIRSYWKTGFYSHSAYLCKLKAISIQHTR